MNSCIRLLPALLAALMLSGMSAKAEEAVPGRPLISAKVDERQSVTLPGNTRPEAKVAANDIAAVPSDLRLEHIYLQLKRSTAQEQVVEAYVNALTSVGSPHYHQWLTAEEFGRRFGVANADIARITDWLKAKGFTVNFVYPGRMAIDFSGTAGQVAQAFQTQIHRLNVDGVGHIANVSDPRIPAALAPAIEGVVSLHDFRAHNKIVRRHPAATGKPADTGTCFGSPCYDLGPGDLATIYNLTPLYTKGITGYGEIIATVEPTNLYSNADWTTFRSTFGLDKYTAGKLEVVHPTPKNGQACANPGVETNGNDGEAALDVEWASAAAPGATIELASCADTNTTDGVYMAIQNLVNSAAPPPVISVSYGDCEADNGAAMNASFNKLYQQAAAEGISVFVATGDNGGTDCATTTNGTKVGLDIDGWGDSGYNVAVGGTDFRDTFDSTNATYWKANAGAPWSTAKSYVPEIPWNDTCASTLIAQYYGGTIVTYGPSGFCNTKTGKQFLYLGGGEGGPSRCYSGTPATDDLVGGTCKGYPKPSWQKGVVGIPADGVRDVPDVSLFASDGSAWSHNYATCWTDKHAGGGPCTGNPVNWAGNAGGTSYSTPIMAAIQVLVDQYTKSRQGNPAPTYYSLAHEQYGTSGNGGCSANLGRSTDTACIFHDVVSGDMDQECVGSINCYRPGNTTYGVLSTSLTAYQPAYKAATGYDLATGIGSVNAYNLAVKWP